MDTKNGHLLLIKAIHCSGKGSVQLSKSYYIYILLICNTNIAILIMSDLIKFKYSSKMDIRDHFLLNYLSGNPCIWAIIHMNPESPFWGESNYLM